MPRFLLSPASLQYRQAALLAGVRAGDRILLYTDGVNETLRRWSGAQGRFADDVTLVVIDIGEGA